MTPEPLQHEVMLEIAAGGAVASAVYRFVLWWPARRVTRPVWLLVGELRLLLSLLIALLVFVGGTAASLGAIENGQFEQLGAIPLLLTLLFPWRTLRRVLVPLGQVRAAHLTARLVDVGFGNDLAGGPAMAAAMALLHKTNASDEDLRWVEEQVNQATPLRACGLVAAAMLRLRAGDRQGARQLLQSIEGLRFKDAPPLAFRAAREWRAADAAERGDWEEVAAVADLSGHLLTSRATLFLGAVARRLLRRENAPSDEQLWAYWLLAPSRIHTRPLLQRALATPRQALPPVEAIEAPYTPNEVDPLRQALLLQVRSWQNQRPSLQDLTQLGEAWDRAVNDDALERRMLVRSMELGTHEASKLKGELQEMAASQLAAQAKARSLALGTLESPGPTIERATKLLRDELLTELETSCEATRRRAIEKRALPATDEWRESLALRARYERVNELAGPMARRLAWPRMRDDLCKLAVWLWNERNEKTIAHAMFQWLLKEATEMNDSEAIDLQTKNVDCGPG